MAEVGTASPFDGHVYLADTSAWTNIARCPAGVQAEWGAALRAHQISTCAVVVYELGIGARTSAELARLEHRLSALYHHPIRHGTVLATLGTMRELLSLNPLSHRVPFIDAVIAATAAEAGRGVLHYDRHFDRLASVLGFESRPIVVFGDI